MLNSEEKPKSELIKVDRDDPEGKVKGRSVRIQAIRKVLELDSSWNCKSGRKKLYEAMLVYGD